MASQQVDTEVSPGSKLSAPLDNAPIRQILEPFGKFLEIESAGGLILLICTGVALIAANSSWHDQWDSFWHLELGLFIGHWEIRHSLVHWINDGLMTIFFFVVGLEIKREVVQGELQGLQKAALPVVAAIGGMIAPALVYLFLQSGAANGWGIPMATDIAFAVGVLNLFGNRVAPSLKTFLLALAIADDIGSILVIAWFYQDGIHLTPLLLAGFGLIAVFGMNRMGVRGTAAYVIAGVFVWFALHYSGVHPTIAGVLLGLMTPSRPCLAMGTFTEFVLHAIDRLDGQIDRPKTVDKLTETARETISPLQRLETGLHPWVAFVIMPTFALANAGVELHLDAAYHPVAWAVAAGLLIGKPLGIFVLSWLAVKFRAAELPTGANWGALLAVSCLGGIGFTMSMFIAGLALEGNLLDIAKIGTFAGSVLSAILGFCLIVFLPSRTINAEQD